MHRIMHLRVLFDLYLEILYPGVMHVIYYILVEYPSVVLNSILIREIV